MPTTGTSYDEVLYQSQPIGATQPDRLATLATLFSLEVAPPSRARVLEIGCATGGNLIPLACRYPQAAFVGLDRSARQIGEGRRDAQALGLRNLELIERDLMAVDESLGRFDYVIAHGVYSWIPAPARQKLLEICAAGLSERGVAYVSYNTLPGWRLRGAVRDMMRYHVAQFADPAQRAAQARALVAFLTGALEKNTSAYATMLREEVKLLADVPDFYLLHEHLEEDNEPVYFHQFFEQAAAAGLEYLCEEEIATSVPELMFGQDVLATLKRVAPDMVRSEQYSDFLRNRNFRRSLLIRPGRAPKREISLARVVGLLVDSKARPEGGNADLQSGAPVRFAAGGRGGGLTTSNPITKAAFGVLRSCWPQAIAFAELYERASAALGRASPPPAVPANPEFELLASDLARAFSVGVAELHCEPSGARSEVSERPLAFAPARHYAGAGCKKLPNARHEVVGLDAFSVELLALLDGSRGTAELIEEIMQRVQSGRMSVQAGGAAVTDPGKVREFAALAIPQALANLRDFAFLVG